MQLCHGRPQGGGGWARVGRPHENEKKNFFYYMGSFFAPFSLYGGLFATFFSLWWAFFTMWCFFATFFSMSGAFSVFKGGFFWACPPRKFLWAPMSHACLSRTFYYSLRLRLTLL